MRGEGGTVLTIQIFGRPRCYLDDTPLIFVRSKSVALLIYLAITRRTHALDVLATLLWSNLSPEWAIANLLTVLTELRERVDEAIIVTHETAAFNPVYPLHLDVATFDAAVRRGIADTDPDMLAVAIRSWEDDILTGFRLPAADEFDAWLLLYRAYMRDRLVLALESLATIHADRGDYRAALVSARRIVALDPWREEAHRRLMMLLTQSGDRAAAIAQYEVCRGILATELGVVPMAETTTLYRSLIMG
jgi:DNA-binding SARP family transcriptional activator